MLKISDLSENCYKSELDLFSLPPTQTAVESGIWDTIQPNSGFDKNPVVEFRIPGDSLYYLDLSQTELYVKIKIHGVANNEQKSEDMLIKTYSPVIPVNNFLHSLFQDITIRFNSTIVEQTQSMYPYRAYLEDTLNYDKECKDSFLQQQLYVKDNASRFDVMVSGIDKSIVVLPATSIYDAATGAFRYSATTLNDAEKLTERQLDVQKGTIVNNQGGLQRRNLLMNNGLLKGKFHLDTFNMNRYLLNSVDVNISMKKSNKSFFLMYDADEDLCTVDIQSMYIKVRRVRVSPSIMLDHAMTLEKTNAKYPIKKVLLKPITLEYNSTAQTLSYIHTGIMPNRLVLAFTTTTAHAGSFRTNPFNFRHFNIESLAVKIASQSVPYSTPLEFRAHENTNQFTEAYNSLFSGIREHPNAIDITEYPNGYFILAFDLTPDLCSSEHYNILKDGNLEIVLRFKNDAEIKNTAITLIVYLEFDNILEITKNRNILCNYQ